MGDSVLEAVRLEEQADLCLANGKHSEAEAHYQQLLILQEKLFGTKDPKVAKTLQNLAMIQRLHKQRVLVV